MFVKSLIGSVLFHRSTNKFAREFLISATKLIGLAAVSAVTLALAACDKKAEVTCASPEASSETIDLIRKALEKQVFARSQTVIAGDATSKSSIRAAIAQIVFTLEDIRTTKEDPNSTKRFCEGKLKIRFPAEDLANADDGRSAAGLGTTTQLADANDVDREAGTFSAKTDYDVQRTDTGEKLYAETDTKSPIMNVAGEVLSASLLHNTLLRTAAAAQEQQRAQETQQNAALNEQKAANVNSAKTDNRLANQAILAVWRAVPAPTRAQLLDQQRAWGRKKDADCHVEAAGASTDPSEMEAARLKCDTRITEERISFLQPFRDQSTNVPTNPQANGM